MSEHESFGSGAYVTPLEVRRFGMGLIDGDQWRRPIR